MGSYGLRTYIWNNRLKSVILLAGFPVLLLLICYAFALIFVAWNSPDVGSGLAAAAHLVPSLIPVALGGALVWFAIAWFANAAIVGAVTGARRVERKDEPRLFNLLENLCISRGITMPGLRIIETDARNAFASGVRKSQYSITVTRGLMDALDDAELEAVLAHELTHIENRDVQLLVIAAVFVGVISLVGDMIIRGPRLLLWSSRSGGTSSSGGSGFGGPSFGGRGGGKGKGGGAVILVLILIAVAIFLLARILAIGLRLAMSRKREYLADAGSVELTKNPDAMIGALRKIAGHSDIPATPAQIKEMFLDHGRSGGLFSTHPSIDDRIAALVRFGGGREPIDDGPAGTAPEQTFGRREESPGPTTPAELPQAGEAPAPDQREVEFPASSGAPPPKGPWG